LARETSAGPPEATRQSKVEETLEKIEKVDKSKI
jgi:hypothetical protein